MRRLDLESDMAGAEADVLGFSHPKVDVTRVGAVRGQNTKVVVRDKISRWVPRDDVAEPQFDFAER
jgi:hypothetical protein